MKKKRRSKLRFVLIISILFLLIAAGVWMTYQMFRSYEALVLENTDNQIISLARSVDRSVESKMERYMENLVHTMEHQECKDAEELWLRTGNETELNVFLENSLLGTDTTIIDILLLEDDKIQVSQSGRRDYIFSKYGTRIGSIQTCLCKNEDGEIAIAVSRENEQGIRYTALIDLKYFFEGVTANLSEDRNNEIVMMDVDGQMMVYRQMDGIKVSPVLEFPENGNEYERIHFLLRQQEKGEEGMEFCDAVSSATERTYVARMAVVPATAETNGLFAVGVSTDYDQVIKPMRSGSVELTFYSGMVLLGIVSVFVLLTDAFKGNQKVLREIEILQEKNAAMEELNRQTQEFAHHQRLELMGTLTSGIAHEFNNLLAPIMGYSILILEKLPPEETEIYDEVLEIYNTSMKAKTVVSRLQDLTRKNAETDFQKLKPDEVVRKAVEIAKPAKPKPVEIQMHLNGENRCIMGNETQISQLLLNLLINAFHATEAIGGTVSVITEIKEEQFVIKVMDNGYGISKENMKRIFEPFFTTKKGGEGTGLGLAIAEQVIEEHNGTINVESKEGEGTLFLVTFPIIPGEV